MAYAILGNPKPAFFDSSGSPLASGTITTQNPTDDAVKASYPTAADADAGTNGTSGDITLDARGEPPTQYWGRDGEDYKVIIKDSAAATVYTLTNIRLPGHQRRATVTFGNGDATPTIAESSQFEHDTNMDAGITDFDDGVVGDVIRIFSDNTGSNRTDVTSNSNILLKDDLDYNMIQNDTLTLCMFEDQVWHEIGRSQHMYASLTAARTLQEGDTGKTFFLNSAGGFSVILPAPALGINFTFIVATAPTTAYTIDTTSGANIMHGTWIDIVGELTYATAQDILSFVANVSLVGDSMTVVSDGTSWFFQAQSGANGGITTGQT